MDADKDDPAHGLRVSWQRAWSGLGASGDGAREYNELVAHYAQPDRHYHSLQHLAECVVWFESVAVMAQHPAEVEAALWFHDAIYDPTRQDNEACSAAWAHSALSAAGVLPERASRVQRLVLATQHTAAPGSADERLLVDIDLSILGASEERFAQYQQQIRAEYAFVPDDVFARKRPAILRAFMDRPRIYSTEHFRSELEGRARSNLRRALGPDIMLN